MGMGKAKKKKSLLLVGIMLAMLALLGVFVAWFNQATRAHPHGLSVIASHLEMLVLLFGLVLIGSVGVFGLARLWGNTPKPFAYDIGLRLVMMGDLVGFISGIADYIGIGAHHQLPYFGPLQTAGVSLGMALMAAGFVCMGFWRNG